MTVYAERNFSITLDEHASRWHQQLNNLLKKLTTIEEVPVIDPNNRFLDDSEFLTDASINRAPQNRQVFPALGYAALSHSSIIVFDPEGNYSQIFTREEITGASLTGTDFSGREVLIFYKDNKNTAE